jgi:hypothetical protein
MMYRDEVTVIGDVALEEPLDRSSEEAGREIPFDHPRRCAWSGRA